MLEQSKAAVSWRPTFTTCVYFLSDKKNATSENVASSRFSRLLRFWQFRRWWWQCRKRDLCYCQSTKQNVSVLWFHPPSQVCSTEIYSRTLTEHPSRRRIVTK